MNDTDVAVVGAGPSGSYLACHLARRGLSVDVFEKDTFPRFHVGQSLLPMSVPLLEEVGLDLSRASYALRKDGALFYESELDEMRRFDFDVTLEGTFTYAYQVERGPFDKALADRAAEHGASIRYGHGVDGWREADDGVELEGEWGRCRARYLVDATGQRAMMARKHDAFERFDSFGKIGSFTLFGNVTNRFFREIFDRGDVLVVTFPDAWAWCIRLPEDKASVGLVEKNPVSGRGAEATLTFLRDSCSLIDRLLEGGERIDPYRRTSNYSFINRRPATDRTVSLGDAYVFLDPIYASAIHRALYSGHRLSAFLAEAAEKNTPLDLDDYFAEINVATRVFVRMIDKFYHTRWIKNMFFAPNPPRRTQKEITTILAGDVWREDNQYQNLLLESSVTSRSEPPRASTPGSTG